VLAAGLDGIEGKRAPGKRLDVNMYEIGHMLKNVRRLPLNLLDALRGFAVSKTLRAALGDELVDSYVKLRMAEWQDYTRHLTQWERDRTLDC
jgi:glutamine synthetase